MAGRIRRTVAAVVMIAIACATAGTAVAGSGGTPVLTGSKRDVYPAATPGETVLGFSRNADGKPNHFDAYIRKTGLPAVKVNLRGQGFAGGLDGTTFVFQSLYRGRSDLRLYNTATEQISSPSAKVNTDRWEWRPTISGNHLLFSRFNPDAAGITDRILLANTATDEVTVVDKQERNKPRYLVAGQVSGNWATWESQLAQTATANVRLYNIVSGNRQILPLRSGRVQYAPSVNANGDVFYIRSKPGCGRSVVLRAHPRGGTDAVVTALPAGFDVFKTYAVDNPGAGTGTTVYYDLYNCTTGALDIYKVSVP
jgi:hypothetical protein